MRTLRPFPLVAALTTALLAALGLAAAGPPPAAAQAPVPLELRSAAVSQRGADVHFRATSRRDWDLRALDPAPGRSLCLVLGDRRVCVVAKGRGAELQRDGRPIPGRVQKPGRRTVAATFAPGDAGLEPGLHRGAVEAVWDGVTSSVAVSLRVAEPRLTGCRAAGASYRTAGPRGRRVVALTFDDGPAPLTSRFLGVLERERVPGTFFMIGQQVGGKGALLRRMLAGGSIPANHSWNHANLGGGGARAASQLRATNAAIRRVSGYTPCLFRAPYGSVGGSLVRGARGLGMLTIQWDVDPGDWRNPGAGAIASRILGATRPGSIILMHDGGGPRGGTLAALPRVITTLKRRGYRFATVADLLGLQPIRG